MACPAPQQQQQGEEPPQEPAPAWYKEPCALGIDEAGRGPVLGPMVYAVAWAPVARGKDLKALGFADSKALSEEKRERLFRVIRERGDLLGHCADVLSAALISGKMLGRDRTSLNQLAFESTAGLIEGVLARGVNLAEAYIDALGDTTKHRERLSQRFPGVRFVVEAKADATYPIVSAASIVAKVTRDHALRDFVLQEGAGAGGEAGAAISTAFGSGYPADPETKRWLAASIDPVFGFPALVRFSWATCTPLLEAAAVPVTFECDADDEPGQQKFSFGPRATGGGGGPVAALPTGGAAASSGAGRHSYFRARKLQRCGPVF